jgi:hypothetical protein
VKAIDNVVKEMRRANRTIAASMVAAWKTGIAFVSLSIVAVLYRSDPSLIVSIAKTGIAFIGLLSWWVDAYFIRKHWELER